MPTKRTPKKHRPAGNKKAGRLRRHVTVQRTVSAAPAAALLRKYALAAIFPGAQVTLRVVGVAEGRLLNRTFRKRNCATNVLSFSYDSHHGDVVLCHPVIRQEAKNQHKPLAAHYAHLVVHGILHLHGHDHMRKSDAARMERAEIRILRGLGFADPYAVNAAVK
jgi:probable rRNA maturation factor